MSGLRPDLDRKSTRLNSSHGYISYAVFCLKKKKAQLKNGLPAMNYKLFGPAIACRNHAAAAHRDDALPHEDPFRITIRAYRGYRTELNLDGRAVLSHHIHFYPSYHF